MARTNFNIDKMLHEMNRLLPPERQPDLRISLHGSTKKSLTDAPSAFAMLAAGELTGAEILPGRESRLTEIISQLANHGGEIRHYTPKKY